MVKKIQKLETVDRMIVNKREKQKISKILENLEICQVYMKYEFMRKNMGYLFWRQLVDDSIMLLLLWQLVQIVQN